MERKAVHRDPKPLSGHIALLLHRVWIRYLKMLLKSTTTVLHWTMDFLCSHAAPSPSKNKNLDYNSNYSHIGFSATALISLHSSFRPHTTFFLKNEQYLGLTVHS